MHARDCKYLCVRRPSAVLHIFNIFSVEMTILSLFITSVLHSILNLNQSEMKTTSQHLEGSVTLGCVHEERQDGGCF